MKGKIRVYCRIRPVNEIERRRGGGDVIAKVEDKYSMNLNTPKGERQFLFDRVFSSNESQDAVFEDTNVSVNF